MYSRAHAIVAVGAATIAILACVVGCDSSRSCTLVGGEGGVAVSVSLPSYHASPGDTITVCASGTCGSADATAEGPIVDGDVLLGDAPVDVTVTLADDTGARIAGGTAAVTPDIRYPNGPKCPPRVLSALVVIDHSGVHQATEAEAQSPSAVSHSG